jgi:hypothetical protein
MSSIESALCAGGTYYPVRVGLMSVQRIEDMKFERVSIIVIDLNNNNVVCAQPSTIPVRTIPCGGACLADEGGAAGRPGAARPERQSQRVARVAAASRNPVVVAGRGGIRRRALLAPQKSGLCKHTQKERRGSSAAADYTRASVWRAKHKMSMISSGESRPSKLHGRHTVGTRHSKLRGRHGGRGCAATPRCVVPHPAMSVCRLSPCL